MTQNQTIKTSVLPPKDWISNRFWMVLVEGMLHTYRIQLYTSYIEVIRSNQINYKKYWQYIIYVYEVYRILHMFHGVSMVFHVFVTAISTHLDSMPPTALRRRWRVVRSDGSGDTKLLAKRSDASDASLSHTQRISPLITDITGCFANLRQS